MSIDKPRPREDVLVSVGLTEAPRTREEMADLATLTVALEARFQYWEILVAADADGPTVQGVMEVSPNIRVLTLRAGLSFYRQRTAVAMEAIGDVVVLTTVSELPLFDAAALAETAVATKTVIIGRRNRSTMLDPVLAALGRSAGFRVSSRDMRTTAYPRTELNKFLAHPDRNLAMRFPPVDPSISIAVQAPRSSIPRPREGRLHRLRLLHGLLVGSAPRVLSTVALGGLLVAGVAMIFAIYTVVTWLSLDTVAPGWFTTSFALSLTAWFLGCAIFGLAIGVQKILEVVMQDTADDVVSEASSIDLFRKAINEFNVELDTHRHPAAHDGIASDAITR